VPSDFKKSYASNTSIITSMPGYDEEQKLPTFGADGASLEHHKIVIVGDRSVGKTCLVMTYGTKQFPEN
jgi:GTPase SAR1 family protein